MQFDPVGAERTSREINEFTEDDEPASKVREGLPARFRMRHTPHYVDELLGDAPLRTVREISIGDIEPPIDDRAELDDLEQSIRRLGVIEPLLVGRRGASYRVIAGMRRLRAAQRIGLATVPCLVHEVDERRLTDMRDAAMQRPKIPQPALAPEAPPSPAPVPAPSPPAREEAALGLEFVAALLPALLPAPPPAPPPAMSAAASDRLRWGVLTDLAAVELANTKLIAEAQETLGRATALTRALVDSRALVRDVVSDVATDARLRAVRLDVSAPEEGRECFLDGSRCRSALKGLLHSLLTLAPRGGTVLTVTATVTSLRPALIVESLLRDADPEFGTEAIARFFEPGWREHPCGSHRAPLLTLLAHTARAHGGRVEVKVAGEGCLVTFVVPRVEG